MAYPEYHISLSSPETGEILRCFNERFTCDLAAVQYFTLPLYQRNYLVIVTRLSDHQEILNTYLLK
jgi:hypothetical protein